MLELLFSVWVVWRFVELLSGSLQVRCSLMLYFIDCLPIFITYWDLAIVSCSEVWPFVLAIVSCSEVWPFVLAIVSCSEVWPFVLVVKYETGGYRHCIFF
jgi:hypothetical protein